MLQFIFLALKLDGVITWPWEITFVPLWIVLCISLVGVLYTIIFAGILLRMTDINAEQRRTSTNSALGYSFLVIPLLVFLVLITNKLDRTVEMKYFAACAPLFLTFFTLMIASFGARGGKLPKIGHNSCITLPRDDQSISNVFREPILVWTSQAALSVFIWHMSMLAIVW